MQWELNSARLPIYPFHGCIILLEKATPMVLTNGTNNLRVLDYSCLYLTILSKCFNATLPTILQSGIYLGPVLIINTLGTGTITSQKT